MDVKKILLCAVLATAAGLTGCEGEVEGRIYGECTGSGSNCKVGGEIKGKVVFKNQKMKAAAQSSTTFDSARFALDVSDSSVTVPANGLVTIKLVDSRTNVIQAARDFAWVKAGEKLVLANPSAVDGWAHASAGSADSVRYDLKPFAVTGVSPGTNTLAVASEYNSQTFAYVSTTWSGRGDACRHSCEQQ